MATVEFTGLPDQPIGDQVAKMRRWLDENGVQATDVQARILHARVTFTATFAQPADAQRFLKEFGEA